MGAPLYQAVELEGRCVLYLEGQAEFWAAAVQRDAG